jgi:hypothetical protein
MKNTLYTIGVLAVMAVLVIPALVMVTYKEVKRKVDIGAI